MDNNINIKEENKSKILNFLEQNDIKYNLIECCSYDRICIDLNSETAQSEKYCCGSTITVLTGDKEYYKIHPNEILYIETDKRASIIYTTNEKLVTNHTMKYWKNMLDTKIFAQPHNSFIVNLSFVCKITKDFVFIKHQKNVYRIYTSQRKIRTFKKAFSEFNN